MRSRSVRRPRRQEQRLHARPQRKRQHGRQQKKLRRLPLPQRPSQSMRKKSRQSRPQSVRHVRQSVHRVAAASAIVRREHAPSGIVTVREAGIVHRVAVPSATAMVSSGRSAIATVREAGIVRRAAVHSATAMVSRDRVSVRQVPVSARDVRQAQVLHQPSMSLRSRHRTA